MNTIVVMLCAKAETSWFYVARYSWLIQCMKFTTYLILCTIYAVSVKCVSFVELGLFLVPFFCCLYIITHPSYCKTPWCMNLTMLLLFSLHSVHYVLRRIFGLKNEEVTGGWRKLHNEKIQKTSLHKTLDWWKQSRRRFTRYVGCVGEVKNL
jgi:hypothetical protein